MSVSIIKFILMASLTAGVYCNTSEDRNPKVSLIKLEYSIWSTILFLFAMKL